MFKTFNKIILILLISFFNLSYLNPSTPPSINEINDKTYKIDALGKKFNATLYINNNLLHIEFVEIDSFPINIYESKLDIDNLTNLSEKLFLKENLNTCLNIFIELFNDNQYSLIENSQLEYILIISPTHYQIENFEINLKLREIDSIEAIRQLFIKTNELIEENKQLKKILNNNILLISNQVSSLLSNLLEMNPFINQISTFKSDFILPRLTKENMIKFKIIIYDLNDGGFIKNYYNDDIKNYLLNGGNIIVTHDHWSNEGTEQGLVDLIGATIKVQNYSPVTKAKVFNNTHPVFNSFYKLELENQSEFNISQTHRTYTKYLDEDEYIQNLYIELNDNYHGEYLFIKEYGKGKIVFWNVGHNVDLKDIEQKLFMNILAWLCNN